MNFFDEDLIPPLAAGIEKRVGGAVAKNVPWILRDLEKNIEDTNGEENDLPVVVKLRVVGLSANRVKVLIDQIQWVRKIQRVEKDFQSLDVDLDQPLLPGLDDESQSAPTVVYDEDHDDMKSILRFAEKYNKKLMRMADPGDANCRVLQVWKGEKGWENYPVESSDEANSILSELVSSEGGLAFEYGGVLIVSAWEIVEDTGYTLYGRTKKGVIYNPRSADMVTIDDKCVCVRMPFRDNALQGDQPSLGLERAREFARKLNASGALGDRVEVSVSNNSNSTPDATDQPDAAASGELLTDQNVLEG